MKDGTVGRFWGTLADIATDVAGHVRFFSRLPVPDRWGDPAALPDFHRTAATIPLAGLLIAIIPALILVLTLQLNLSPLVAALLSIGVHIAITGGLHEDGLADAVDGFWGGMTIERRLEIMKDSRVGSYGVLALILCIGLKASLLAALAEALPAWGVALLLLSSAAISRAAMVWIWYHLPNARGGGLSHSSGQPSIIAMYGAAGLGILISVLLAFHVTFWASLIALSLVALSAWAVARIAKAKIGGQTGDVLGACQHISELAYLIGLCIVLGHG